MSKRINPKHCLRCGTTLENIHSYGQIRPVCPACGWIHFADPKVAAAVLVEKEGEVLLVQRSYNPHQGAWSLPAGFVNAGEDPAEAARRECEEETGLQVRITRLLDVYAKKEHPGGSDFIIVYGAEVLSGTLAAADDADDAAFFPRDSLPELAFDATKYILKNY